MGNASYLRAATVEEACRTVAADPDDRRLLGGGTALVLMLRNGLIEPQMFVDVTRIAGLRGIETSAREIRIGAVSTLTEIARSAQVRQHAAGLALACSAVGNVRVRNVATIGGNLAESDYASDPPSALISLGASCTLQAPDSIRTLPVADLITGHYSNVLQPGELITNVTIPIAVDPNRRLTTYLRHTTRSHEDRPAIGVAAAATVDAEGRIGELRVVVGACAATPQLLPDVCATAVGRVLDPTSADSIAAQYAQCLKPLADPRASTWYRRRLIAVFVRRALESLIALADQNPSPEESDD